MSPADRYDRPTSSLEEIQSCVRAGRYSLVRRAEDDARRLGLLAAVADCICLAGAMTEIPIDNECPLCGASAREVSIERDVAFGPDKQVRVPAPEMRCGNCGATFTTASQVQIADERAAAIVRSAGRILGFEIRRIRARLGLTQAQLEETLGLGSKTVTRWERDLVELEGPTVSILRALEAGKLVPRDVMALRTGGGSSERKAGPDVAPEVLGAAQDGQSPRPGPRRAWAIREE